MENKRKSGEFELFKSNVEYFTIRTKVTRISTGGKTKGNPVTDDYYKLFVCKSKEDQNIIFERIEDYFKEFEGIEKSIEKEDLCLESYKNKYKSKSSIHIKTIKTGEASKIKLEPEFKAINLEQFKREVEEPVQTAIEGFEERSINKTVKDFANQLYNGDPSSRKQNEKGMNIIVPNIRDKYINNAIKRNKLPLVTNFSSPSKFNEEVGYKYLTELRIYTNLDNK